MIIIPRAHVVNAVVTTHHVTAGVTADYPPVGNAAGLPVTQTQAVTTRASTNDLMSSERLQFWFIGMFHTLISNIN